MKRSCKISANRNPLVPSGFKSYCQNIICFGATCFFILLFTYWGVVKLQEINLVQTSLMNIPIARGSSTATIVSFVIPITEIIAAILLIFQKSRRVGYYGILALLILYTLFFSYVLFLSPVTPCSCGGITSLFSWQQQFYFSLGCMALAIYALKQQKKRKHI